jgi:hypothetical protein
MVLPFQIEARAEAAPALSADMDRGELRRLRATADDPVLAGAAVSVVEAVGAVGEEAEEAEEGAAVAVVEVAVGARGAQHDNRTSTQFLSSWIEGDANDYSKTHVQGG